MDKLAFSSEINERPCGFRESMYSWGGEQGWAEGQGAIVQLSYWATSGKLERLIGEMCLGSLSVK